MRHAVHLLVLLVLSVVLSGCILNSSPDITYIGLNPDNFRVFSVSAVGECKWLLDGNSIDDQVTKTNITQYTYTFYPDPADIPSTHTLVVNVYVGAKVDTRQWTIEVMDCDSMGPYSGSFIVDSAEKLDEISQYNLITGDLTIENMPVQYLYGLDCIRSVMGDLRIQNNPNLINLEGLYNITHIGGSLNITNNPQLSDLSSSDTSVLSPLGKVPEVGGLKITDNRALTNLNGLQSLDTINGNIEISNNEKLTDISLLGRLPGQDQITGSLIIQNNSSVTELSALKDIQSIDHDLIITGNSKLHTLGLVSLDSIGGDEITIDDNGSGNIVDSPTALYLNGLFYINPAVCELFNIHNKTMMTVYGEGTLGPEGNDLQIVIGHYKSVAYDNCIASFVNNKIKLEINNTITTAGTIYSELLTIIETIDNIGAVGLHVHSGNKMVLSKTQPDYFHFKEGREAVSVSTGAQIMGSNIYP